jgi:hypothetical protein
MLLKHMGNNNNNRASNNNNNNNWTPRAVQIRYKYSQRSVYLRKTGANGVVHYTSPIWLHSLSSAIPCLERIVVAQDKIKARHDRHLTDMNQMSAWHESMFRAQVAQAPLGRRHRLTQADAPMRSAATTAFASIICCALSGVSGPLLGGVSALRSLRTLRPRDRHDA